MVETTYIYFVCMDGSCNILYVLYNIIFNYIYTCTYIYIYYRRKFKSQTSDNMET